MFVIAEPPGPPQNMKLVDIWGFNVALEWSPPADNGNSEIKGYTVQKSDKKSGVSTATPGPLLSGLPRGFPSFGQPVTALFSPQKWFTALERCTRTSCTISDLIMGNTYSFRVFAENACGLSEKAAVASGVAHIEKTSGDRDTAWGWWGGQEGSCPLPVLSPPVPGVSSALGWW